MIPYFFWQTIALGPLTIQVWGLFVSLGALAALILSLRLARRKQLSEEIIWDLFVWLLVGGIIGARAFYVIYYDPSSYIGDPTEALRIWNGGASSLGGFLGALAALIIYVRVKKISFSAFRLYADILGLSFWLGWAIGRIGCFIIHDHPGRLTDFFLAVNFPDGARYDLGLYESVVSLAIFGLAFFLYRRWKDTRPGSIVFLTFLVYAVIRFMLDFLRAADLSWSDPRYYYLTPAQWGMVVFVVLTSVVFLRRILRAWKSLNK